MKRLALFLAFLFFLAPGAIAQNHGQIGAFAEYYRFKQAQRNLFGVGVRASFNVVQFLQLEGELAYDFERSFAERFSNPSNPVVGTNFQRSGVRVLHGVFGPKIKMGGPDNPASHFFVVVKGGFVNFGFSDVTVPVGFVSKVNDVRSSHNGIGEFYPGGGVEGSWGPVGLRVDIGDEMYFNHGTHHNLRVTFGPHIRF